MQASQTQSQATLKNSIRQALLFLRDDAVVNINGQNLGYFKDNVLYNLQHQRLGQIRNNQLLNSQNQVLGSIEDHQLFNSNGQKILRTEGVDQNSITKIGLAFFFFLQ